MTVKGKDQVDLRAWTNEDFDKEYALIKAKKSNLPYSQRKLIMELTEKPTGEKSA